MKCYRSRLPAALVLILRLPGPSAAFAQAGTITKDMQNNCVNDYKKFCGDYGLQSAALNLCMHKAGPGLSPACVGALVRAGKITQAQVDKHQGTDRKGGAEPAKTQSDAVPAPTPPTRNKESSTMKRLLRLSVLAALTLTCSGACRRRPAPRLPRPATRNIR